jgi:flagellar hook-associated protein 2
MATTSPTTSSGTAGVLQSLGVGSGLDINSMVQQLVAADTSGDNSRIARETAQTGAQITAMGQLKGALASFQSALSQLSSQTAFQTKTAASADNTVYTATATSAAAAGAYQVEVVNLAQSQQLISDPLSPFVGGSAAVVGTGTLTLSLGSTSFNVSIDATRNTLGGIRDAINSASDNPGISATIVNGTGGGQLVLSSNKTGATNTITVAALSSDGLNRLVYNPSATGNFTELQAALDSTIKVAGVSHTAATNTVSDAIDGVTLNLIAQKPGTQLRLTIANDSNTVTNRVQNFVVSYNSLRGVLTTVGGYNAAAQTAGPLLGDALETNIERQLSRGLTDPVSSAAGSQYSSLAGLGVTTNNDGTLILDASKLNGALATNFGAVSAVFSAKDGVATRLNSFLTDQLAATGGIAQRNGTLSQRQKNITTEQKAVTARAAQLQLRYQAQFTAMDSLLSKMQQTSSFLTQQFVNLQKQTASGG